jgi:hypothetical protein
MTFQGLTESEWAALGRDRRVSPLNKFGENPDFESGTDEDIWDGGSDWLPPTEARIHNINSTDALDTVAGTGARNIQIIGVNENWDEVSEEIEMAGTATVPTTNYYRNIYRMLVSSGGGAGGTILPDNQGTILATAQIDDTVTAQIQPSNGQTLMAIYTVPAGHTLLMNNYYANLNADTNVAAARANATMYTRGSDSDASWLVKHKKGVIDTGSSDISHVFDPPLAIPEKTTIKMRVANALPAQLANANITAGFDGKLVKG